MLHKGFPKRITSGRKQGIEIDQPVVGSEITVLILGPKLVMSLLLFLYEPIMNSF